MQDPQRASAKTPDADSPTERYARLVIASAFAVGVAFRVFQYAAGRSLWLDEVALASALLQRPVSGAVLPGPWGAVPPGFLVLVKLCSLALGSGELALRLVPLLGGVVSLALFIYVVRRYLPPAAGAFAMVLFAAASYPIYYASELKQYSTDAAVCVGLLLWAITLRDGPFTARRATILALVGFGCVVLSLTSVFVLGGIVLSLLLSAWREGRKAELRRLLAVGVCWAVVIGVPGLLFLHRITGSGGYALSFWRAGFMPMPPRSLREAAWLPLALLKLFQEPLGVLEFSDSWVNYMQIAAGALAALLGTVWVWRRRPVLAGFLTFPIVLALVASALKAYPFGGSPSTSGRVLLFLVPPVVLLMAGGVAQLSSGGTVARILAALLVVGTAGPSLHENLTRIPFGRTETKSLLGYLEANRQPGDALYVHYDIQPAFRFYRGRYDLANVDVRMGVCARLNPAEYLTALNGLRGRPRVWILFAGGTGAYGYVERILMLNYLDHIGRRLDDRVAVGTSLFLYDLRDKFPAPGEFQGRIPNFPPGSTDDCPFFENV